MSVAIGQSHDPSRFRSRNRVGLVLGAVCLLALAARLVVVQVVRGDRYEKYAVIERVSKVRAQAPRGLIKAADGTVLARNIESHSVEILTHRVKPERIAPIVDHLGVLLDLSDTERADLLTELHKPVDPRKRKPLLVRRDLVSSHCPYDSSPLELVAERPHRHCSACGRGFEPVPARKTCPFDQRRLVATGKGWHCGACDRDFAEVDQCPYDGQALRRDSHILQCPLCRRSFNDEVAVLRANGHRLPEVRVVADIQREYPFRYLASHVIGYVGYVSPRDVAPLLPFGPPRFGLTDRVGRSGMEAALDSALRGLDGEQILVRRSEGEGPATDLDDLVAALRPRPVTAGLNVRLTLDLELQRAVKVALKDVFAGAAVVIDATTGHVLAMYAKPSFDPNALAGKRAPQARPLADISAYAPLLNKALHGYPPASTYKVVAAIAGLEEGLITPRSEHTCHGHYDYGGRRFHCHNRRGHGEVDLYDALRASCDVYFYRVGEELGIDRLEAWARKLGFGEPTGIEIREAVGRVPSLGWYKRHVPGGYYPGFALSTAVGQKDVLASPLQLARVYAAVANGGWLPHATVVAGFEDAQGKLVAPNREPPRRLELRKTTLPWIQDMLFAVVNEPGGTAFGNQPALAQMAGKTGTAQAPQRVRKDVAERLREDPAALQRLSAWLQNDHAWFIGWAPFRNPDIVVAVLVEHGGSGGHNAAPIARQIADAWFAKHPPKAPPVAVPKRERKKQPEAQPVDDSPDEAAPGDAESGPSLPDPDPQPEPGAGAEDAP
ncbi:MAG: hypothetical protein FJ100_16125 [Deltaproteobacteria bacterium]|nr:hypothetical protein [Deltaproteobacteria bacterium]